VALEQAYDPALAELYAGEAFIKKRQNLLFEEFSELQQQGPEGCTREAA
jgi:hypothetical protein